MKVIIDTDMLIDDWMAILYLLQNKDVEVIGIAVTGTGGSYLEPGCHNALSLLKIAGLDKTVPVCSGAETALQYSNVYPKAIRDNAADFMGIPIPPSTAKLYPDNYYLFYYNLIKNSNEKVTLLSIGGASNLGVVLPQLIEDPVTKNKIERIFMMGGAIDVKGNLADLTDTYSFNQVAEWNVFVDVSGADIVFQSGIPVTLIPLDACKKIVFTKYYASQFSSQAKGKISPYISKMFDAYFQSVGKDVIPIFDPLAAVVLSNYNTPNISKLITDRTVIKLHVDLEMKVSGTPDTGGKTNRDDSLGSPIEVCMSADQDTFNSLYLSPFKT